MLVAAIYDIHANLPALEAVLREIAELAVDRIIVGGDVLPGPMPVETLTRLFNLPIPVDFIYGNGELAVLEEAAGRTPPAVPEQYRPIIRWTAEQLPAEYNQQISKWPKTVGLEMPGFGDVLFCHATPRNENKCFTRITPADLLAPMFDGVDTDLIVCGHTHMQFDRTIGRSRVVNAGSVGMPFGIPGANWLLLGEDVQLLRTSYDLSEAASRIRATSYPDARNFVTSSVLNPPSEDRMLEIYSRAEHSE